jgi:SAM-dependent methyltransferase
MSDASVPATLFASLEDLVACPRCVGTLVLDGGDLRCASCDARFRQEREDCLDLLPHDGPAGDAGDWAGRQREMEDWYREMLGSDWSRACFANDYGPFAPVLARYEGTVLDLGGGVGVTRHWLGPTVRSVVVDPSLLWLGSEWATLADAFPCLATRPAFVRGIGELLPIRSGVIDVVLAFWSINHAADPARVFRQVRRVLRPGGRFLLVLEDMEPRWRDLVRPAMRAKGVAEIARQAWPKIRARLSGRGWSLQSDHLRIGEEDLRAWSADGFDVERREWVGRYLTYEYVARGG